MMSVAVRPVSASHRRLSAPRRILRPRTAPAAQVAVSQLHPMEEFWFNYFNFDTAQFNRRVQNDIALLKKQSNAKTQFSHEDYQAYYVPKSTTAPAALSATSLRKQFENHPFPTSNPFLLAFLHLDSSYTKDEASEFYGITVTPEDVRFHLWEDLIRRVVYRTTQTMAARR
jgi:hypothetical protein